MPARLPKRSLKVLFVTSEVYPLCKTGGLGDVSAALPASLRKQQVDVRILIPGYPKVLEGLRYKRKIAEFNDLTHFPPAKLLSANLQINASTSIPVFIIDCPSLYQRAGGPYLDATGHDWPDNAHRFGLLSKIAALLSSDASPLPWQPDVTHCNDWQSGLTPAYLHFYRGSKSPTLMSIHNLAFQGCFPSELVAQLGLPLESYSIQGIEYYGSLSFIKAGLYYADHISTVSPSYAHEIQQDQLGFGLHGLLSARKEQISGIVNGIDTIEWDPSIDIHIAKRYSIRRLPNKQANKLAIQQKLGLEPRSDHLLFAAISRFSYQKGYDLLLEVAPKLLELHAQLAVLGAGDASIEKNLVQLAKQFPGRMVVHVGYEEALSHQLEAGADSFLMPSRFEPCGLNQMYSQHYGTIPLVHATGGLIDTVVDYSPETLKNGTASGFQFHDLSSDAFFEGIKRVVAAYQNKGLWEQLQKNGMRKDFSWKNSAAAYCELYQKLTRAH
ncbi:MAG: glycogen synthase GlgA [Nitrosomonas sp.]|nr:glycogen synthase GlgA [Nitrosomonas sp.]